MLNKAQDWLVSARIYLDRRVLALFFLGFASGLPFLLVYSTLSFRLRLNDVSLTDIGWFSLAGLAYGLKFVWAPLVDHLPIPFMTKEFGQRRGWLIASQLAVFGGILCLGTIDPAESLILTAFAAVGLAFFSATQDIVADALRIEVLSEDEQGGGAANFVNGYRAGTLVAGAGALVIAEHYGWFWAYVGMAGFMLPGILAVSFLPEPEQVSTKNPLGTSARLWDRLHCAIVTPFNEFAQRENWLLILIFITLYKYGDALLGAMANPFYADLGFSGSEIGIITKGWGLAMSFFGAFIGGLICLRIGLLRALFVTGVAQLAGNFAFAALAFYGKSLGLLTLAIAVENLSGAMATAAFVAYLSSLCNLGFTATQYALLTSLTALARTVFTAGGGWLADELGWVNFFLATTIAAVPGLVLLGCLMRRGRETSEW